MVACDLSIIKQINFMNLLFIFDYKIIKKLRKNSCKYFAKICVENCKLKFETGQRVELFLK
jgi:hypothetical protein